MVLSAGSNLERILRAGHKAVTCECGTPRDAGIEEFRRKASCLRGCADAVNVPDNPRGAVHLCSLAGSRLLLDWGLEPVLQMVTRDMNRIALQSQLLGAAALGVRNVLCLTGDHQSFGDHPQAKNVFDLDSIQWLHTIRGMRDEGRLLGGTRLKERPAVFLGAAVNPSSRPYEYEVLRLAKKIRAGAQFVQTQCLFDLERFREFMKMARDMGLTEQCFILAGITPLKSAATAAFLEQKVPGIRMPPEILRRLRGLPEPRQAAEGFRMAVEQIQECLDIPGVAGIHLMAVGWEEQAPELLAAAGLLPRPRLKETEG